MTSTMVDEKGLNKGKKSPNEDLFVPHSKGVSRIPVL